MHCVDRSAEGLVDLVAELLTQAEEALVLREPERLTVLVPQLARVCRVLRSAPLTQWPSSHHRVMVLGGIATRVAALQQAVARAQNALGRELGVLMPRGSQGLEVYAPSGALPAVRRGSGAYA